MPRPSPTSLLGVLAGAVAVGVLSRVEERTAGFSVGLSSDTTWVALPFAAGATSDAVARGAVRGMTALTVANLAYYGLVLLLEPAYLVAVAGHPSRH